MSKHQLKLFFEGANFYPAVLRENPSGWMVEYYTQNPRDGSMVRQRIRVERLRRQFKTKGEARKRIHEIIKQINFKLENGFNPLFQGEDARLYTKMSEVADLYIAEKRKELRPDTLRSYSSLCTILCGWINRQTNDIFCSEFTRNVAVRFMDYIYNERNVSARTYNNYIKQARCLFEWCVDKGYAKENPFATIKPKRNEKKERVIIDADTRKRIAEHLSEDRFLLVCMLVYHSLIRPKEIRNLKVGDIDLERKVVRVSGEIAKNHNTRLSSLSDQIIGLIEKWGIMKYGKDCYIFSDVDTLECGMEKLYGAKFTKCWTKLRRELKLDKRMQLYSLRDTGIFEMLKNGVDDLSVMQHADHSSLDITTIYANHHDPLLAQRIREKTPDF